MDVTLVGRWDITLRPDGSILVSSADGDSVTVQPDSLHSLIIRAV